MVYGFPRVSAGQIEDLHLLPSLAVFVNLHHQGCNSDHQPQERVFLCLTTGRRTGLLTPGGGKQIEQSCGQTPGMLGSIVPVTVVSGGLQ